MFELHLFHKVNFIFITLYNLHSVMKKYSKFVYCKKYNNKNIKLYDRIIIGDDKNYEER